MQDEACRFSEAETLIDLEEHAPKQSIPSLKDLIFFIILLDCFHHMCIVCVFRRDSRCGQKLNLDCRYLKV